MDIAETVRAVIARSALLQADQITPERPMAQLLASYLDWVELLNDLDSALAKIRDLDDDEWMILGGNPAPHICLSPTVTVRDVIEYVTASPKVTLERIVRKAVARFSRIHDADFVPADFRLFLSPRRWAKLRMELNRGLRPLDCRLERRRWNDLGRGRSGKVVTHIAPTLLDVIGAVHDAYTIDIA